MKYHSIHRGLGKYSYIRIPLGFTVVFVVNLVCIIVFKQIVLDYPDSMMAFFLGSIVIASFVVSKFKAVPTEGLAFDLGGLVWVLDVEGDKVPEKIEVYGLKTVKTSLDYLTLQTPEGRVFRVHRFWCFSKPTDSPASCCELVIDNNTAVLKGYSESSQSNAMRFVGNCEEMTAEAPV